MIDEDELMTLMDELYMSCGRAVTYAGTERGEDYAIQALERVDELVDMLDKLRRLDTTSDDTPCN